MPPSEPIEEVLNKYTDTLCNTQKKTSLERSLLQDIPTLNGNDSIQLEDWLTDIETASELMGESRTKTSTGKIKRASENINIGSFNFAKNLAGN